MVYYFTSNTVTPSAFIYVGKDKVESAQEQPIPDSAIPLTKLGFRRATHQVWLGRGPLVPRRQSLLGAYLRAIARRPGLGDYRPESLDRLCAIDQGE